jgi:hypothetical protein
MSIDASGTEFGDRALIPQSRIKPYNRDKSFSNKRTQQQGGLSGILRHTLEQYPGVKYEYEKFVLSYHAKFTGVRFDRRFLAAKFRDLLRKAGVQDDSWPFNESGLGLRSIEKYTNNIINSDFEIASRTLGVEGATHASLGTGIEGLISGALPFDIIQLDAYKVDKFCIVNTEPLPGVFVSRVIDRFWLLAVIEAETEGVMAARYVFSSEVRAQDVEDLLLEAFLGTWEPRKNVQYYPGSGMLSYIVPEAKNVLFGVLYLDNAMAHHANKIKKKLQETLGFSTNYGQLKRPERRSIIENTFKQTAHQFMQRLPSTTGSNPRNGRAKNPEGNAEKYNIFVNQAEDALDVWLANYNITPKLGKTFSLSPAEFLRAMIHNDKQKLMLPTASKDLISRASLLHDVEYCVVRGSAVGGIAPHITLDKAKYTSPVLANSAGLIGSKLLVKIFSKDFRTVEAFLPTGERLGVLTVLGYWRKTPHSRITRKAINRAHYARTFEIVRKDDIVLSYVDSLIGLRGKKNLLEFHRMTNEMEKSENLDQQVINTAPLYEDVLDATVASGMLMEVDEKQSSEESVCLELNPGSVHSDFLDLGSLEPDFYQSGGGIINEDE